MRGQLKRAITSPYAGATCPKCGQGMNHLNKIKLSDDEEKRIQRRYGSDICDECKTEKYPTTPIIVKK